MEETASHGKTASDRAEWTVEVSAAGEATMAYRVVYSWK
jgi:hypothetical protein